MNPSLQKTRVLYLDLLRVAATVAVIFIHISAENFSGLSVHSREWQVLNLFDSLSHWAVPVFVMISGVFFLDPDRPFSFRRLLSKNLLRIVTAFVFWSAVYAIFEYAFVVKERGAEVLLSLFIKGEFHLWFLYMIAGLYLIVPLLRKITASEKLTEYFLLLFLCFGILIPAVLDIPGIPDVFSTAYSQMHFTFALKYSGYFMAGYYFSKKDLSRRVRYAIYALGIVSLALTPALNYWASEAAGKTVSLYIKNFSFNMCFTALAIFVFGKYGLSRISFSEKGTARLLRLSEISFGIYLVHVLFKGALLGVGFNSLSFNPVLAVPLKVLTVFILSALLSDLLNRIKPLRKYIV